MKKVAKAWLPPTVQSFMARLRCVFRVMRPSRDYRSLSYYPDTERKPYLTILRELVATAWKWGRGDSVETCYFVFGLDRSDRRLSDYVFPEEFAKVKDPINSYSFDFDTILNNKSVTNILFRSWNLPVPGLLGSIEKHDGILQWVHNGHARSLRDHLRDYDVQWFCKPLAGNCGHGALMLETSGGRIFANSSMISPDELGSHLSPPMTLEEPVRQHEVLSALHPESINTIRHISVKGHENDVHVISTFQRIGCGGRRVDNWGSGGIIIPFAQAGVLDKVGYFEPGFGFSVTEHPDTKIAFEGYRIPFFQESVEVVKRAHCCIGDVHSVGWDIAVTPHGPVIIEANGDWGPVAPQVFHGMRKDFETIFMPRYNELFQG